MKAMTERTLRKLCKEFCWLGAVLSDMGKKFPGALHPEDVVVNIVRARDTSMLLTTLIVSRFYSFSAQYGSPDTLEPDLYLVAGGFPEKIHHCKGCKIPNPTKKTVGAHAIVFASVCRKFDAPTKLVIQVVKAPLGTFNDALKSMYLRGDSLSLFEE